MMNMVADVELLKQELVSLSHNFYRRGWSLATSGNFSARVDNDHFLITASGKDKGSLSVDDFVLVNLHEAPPENASTETLLHATIYNLMEQTACVLHTHSLSATFLSLRQPEIILEGYEMLKALSGVTTHHHLEVIPVLPNSQDLSALSEEVLPMMKYQPNVHSFLIAGHGLYTWGDSIFKARMQLEALEFMLECEAKKSGSRL
jgi:methylthioribulose-1-phosphate dehydratase